MFMCVLAICPLRCVLSCRCALASSTFSLSLRRWRRYQRFSPIGAASWVSSAMGARVRRSDVSRQTHAFARSARHQRATSTSIAHVRANLHARATLAPQYSQTLADGRWVQIRETPPGSRADCLGVIRGKLASMARSSWCTSWRTADPPIYSLRASLHCLTLPAFMPLYTHTTVHLVDTTAGTKLSSTWSCTG